jgi:RHS repeat-associated protein
LGDEFTAYITSEGSNGSGSSIDGVAGAYRYGFNGKENDNEVKGDGNQIAFENRIYDSRLARWFSVDPLQKKYPEESNYIFTSDNPIFFADVDGRDRIVTTTRIKKDGTYTQIRRTYKNDFYYSQVHGASGRTTYFKSNIIENLTIDDRTGTMNKSSFINSNKEIGLFEYVFRSLTQSGSNSDKEAYGFRIYGNGKDGSWQKGLPSAAPGSESLDLGKLLEMVGGIREAAMSPSEIATNEKVKYVYEGISKAMDIIDKSVEATKATTEKEQQSEKPADVILSVHRKKTGSMQANSQVRITSVSHDKPDTVKNIIYDNPKEKN